MWICLSNTNLLFKFWNDVIRILVHGVYSIIRISSIKVGLGKGRLFLTPRRICKAEHVRILPCRRPRLLQQYPPVAPSRSHAIFRSCFLLLRIYLAALDLLVSGIAIPLDVTVNSYEMSVLLIYKPYGTTATFMFGWKYHLLLL